MKDYLIDVFVSFVVAGWTDGCGRPKECRKVFKNKRYLIIKFLFITFIILSLFDPEMSIQQPDSGTVEKKS